jgi:hypothetical protein
MCSVKLFPIIEAGLCCVDLLRRRYLLSVHGGRENSVRVTAATKPAINFFAFIVLLSEPSLVSSSRHGGANCGRQERTLRRFLPGSTSDRSVMCRLVMVRTRWVTSVLPWAGASKEASRDDVSEQRSPSGVIA